MHCQFKLKEIIVCIREEVLEEEKDFSNTNLDKFKVYFDVRLLHFDVWFPTQFDELLHFFSKQYFFPLQHPHKQNSHVSNSFHLFFFVICSFRRVRFV
jgi:hypothetical protein